MKGYSDLEAKETMNMMERRRGPPPFEAMQIGHRRSSRHAVVAAPEEAILAASGFDGQILVFSCQKRGGDSTQT